MKNQLLILTSTLLLGAAAHAQAACDATLQGPYRQKIRRRY
ncbi:hypothetical protein [Pseudomonas mediterranea]|nr:hypothetical protein [Pseudomonas mediterranea]MDU9029072.1 hypothetical protein [Pseudomonas mediterranea]